MRLFARKLRRVGLTLMRRVDTFTSVNLPPKQPVASLFHYAHENHASLNVGRNDFLDDVAFIRM